MSQLKLRKLLKNEIEYILKGVEINHPDPNVRIINGESLKETYRQQLRNISVPDDSVASVRKIKRVALTIKAAHEKAILDPGTTAGLLAATAASASVTQASLNVFHKAGARENSLSGIDAIKEVFDAVATRKAQSMFVHFKNKNMTVEDVFKIRHLIEGMSVANLIIDHAIFRTEDIKRYPYEAVYRRVSGKSIPNSQYIMRLYIDLNKLYSHKITTEDIAYSIEKEAPPRVLCVVSPTYGVLLEQGEVRGKLASARRYAIVDIYPDEAMTSASMIEKGLVGAEKSPEIFLQTIVFPSLKNWNVTGIAGIQKIYPVQTPLWSIVQDYYSTYNATELQDLPEDRRRAWTIQIAKHRIMKLGVPVTKLVSFLTSIGAKYNPDIPSTENTLFMIFPTNENPNDYVNRVISDDRKMKDIFRNQREEDIRATLNFIKSEERVLETDKKFKVITDFKERRRVKDLMVTMGLNVDENSGEDFTSFVIDVNDAGVTPKDYILSLIDSYKKIRNHPSDRGNYVYLETLGINMKDVLSHPLVDPTYTYTNNFHEMWAYFGIDAAKNVLARDAYEILTADGSTIDPRHVTLIADHMTHYGLVYGVNFAGAGKGEKGVLSLASIEQAGSVIIKETSMGSYESTKATSTAIFTGSRPQLGTGIVNLVEDRGKLEQYYKNKKNLDNLETRIISTMPIEPPGPEQTKQAQVLIADSTSTSNNEPVIQFNTNIVSPQPLAKVNIEGPSTILPSPNPNIANPELSLPVQQLQTPSLPSLLPNPQVDNYNNLLSRALPTQKEVIPEEFII
ncbi:DNA-directed RNA polymerase 1 RPB1 (domain 5) [Orpheovirus IHUMI-LCC2]|uniref:DNA-directed RNA polymerase n=1 Tax=Orpheovirus IHUMI-LCC2 TaxID=2023057 RepID=A0A2I2L5Q8_9VIRU|nr:DNA-directed RNA polymerase 1 RPB1 (domain 5) [Orpheovirus IHUMI-LCC2]SNW62882.1 DNA-directed RNA polymerase 1 RPB1 (domain 5) [Orpheovirus IHUMI-LCC2]